MTSLMTQCSDVRIMTYYYQDHDNFSLLDADTWSGLTWLSLAGLGSLVSGLMLAWSCVGKQITGTERRYRVKM